MNVAFLASVIVPARALGRDMRLAQCRIDSWGVRDGLPSRDINAIAQTPDGYIWLGTGGGLIRFDGYAFDTFTSQNTPGLKSNDITALYVTREGKLWVGTNWGGFGTLDGTGFHRVDTDISNWNIVITFYEAPDGSMWVGGNGKFRLYHVVNDRVVLARPMTDEVYGLSTLPNGDVLCLLWANGLWRIHNGKEMPYLKQQLQTTPMLGLTRGSDGSYWMCSADKGLYRLKDGHLTIYSMKDGLSGNVVHTVYQDQAGILWVGTNNGIDRWDGKSFVPFRKSDGLSDSEVRSIYEDREGNLWVAAGTYLDRFASTKLAPFTLSEGDAVASVFDHDSIAPARDGGVWVTSDLGLWHITPTSARHVSLPHRIDFGAVDSVISGPNGLIWLVWQQGDAKNTVASIPESSLMRGTSDGLRVFHAGNGLSLLASVAEPHKLVAFAQDMVHIIGIDGRQGLRPYDAGFVFTAQRDAAGAYWIGCDSGLYRIWHGHYGTMDDGLPAGTHVLGIDTGDARNPLDKGDANRPAELWLATDHGLAHFVDGRSRVYGTSAGLPDDNIYQVLLHGDTVWAGSSSGIIEIKLADINAYDAGRISRIPVKTFAAADGLRSFPIQYSACRSSDGKLWFVGPKGVTMVDPDHLSVNPIPPPVLIESAQIDGRSISPGVPNNARPGRGNLQIQCAALTYAAPERVVFRYKLEGFDALWQEEHGRSRLTASYTNLPPGRYRFLVTASNNDGVWNTVGTGFVLQIAPHFYQTYWFFGLCAVAVIALIIFIVHVRSHRIAELARKLRVLVDERTVELRQANDQLYSAHEELSAQNEELQMVQEELVSQNDELVRSREILAQQNELLENLATTDGLTGVKNRRRFQEKLEEEFKYSARYAAPLAVVLLDVDKFKSYNDTYGHPAGDSVLKQVASILTECARETDFVARYGGEEFVVILPQTDVSGALEVAERLRAGIEGGRWVERAVTASFGVANITQGASTPADLIAQADEALYESKEAGRNRVSHYDTKPRARAVNQ